jgi:hypothetical protein
MRQMLHLWFVQGVCPLTPIDCHSDAIMATLKRTRVCDIELGEPEQCAKKHMKNFRESKACALWAAPLLEAGCKLPEAKDHLETLSNAHKKLASRIRELRGASLMTAETSGQSTLEAAKETFSCLHQLEVGLDIEQLRTIISRYLQVDDVFPVHMRSITSTYLHVDDVLRSLAVVLPKVEYYKDHPKDLPKEVHDLNNVLKQALILDDESEILMNAFRRAFDRASSALLKVGNVITDSPLTVADVAVYTNYVDDQLDAILLQFVKKEGLQTVAKVLAERRFVDLSYR